MIKILFKKFKKTNNYKNLDGKDWVQRIILKKNYLIPNLLKKI